MSAVQGDEKESSASKLDSTLSRSDENVDAAAVKTAAPGNTPAGGGLGSTKPDSDIGAARAAGIATTPAASTGGASAKPVPAKDHALGILQGTGSLLFVTLLVGFAAYLFFSMRVTERPAPIVMDMWIRLEEAYTGVQNKSVRFQRHIVCPRCRGSGADTPRDVMTCPHCLGRGQVKVMHMFPFGPAAVMQTCQHCRGTGQLVTRLCTQCQGHGRVSHTEVTYISVPRGAEEYYQITVANMGHEELGKGFGDLVIKLRTSGHGEYRRDEAHLHKHIQVALSQAISGSRVEVKMLDGTIRTVVFDHLVADGEVIEVKGAGMPLPPSQQLKGQELSFGSLYLHVQVRFPTSRLSQAEKDALRLLLPDEHED